MRQRADGESKGKRKRDETAHGRHSTDFAQPITGTWATSAEPALNTKAMMMNEALRNPAPDLKGRGRRCAARVAGEVKCKQVREQMVGKLRDGGLSIIVECD